MRKKDYMKALGHGMGLVMCILSDDGGFMRDQELWCFEKEWKKLLKDMKFVLNGLLKASDADVRSRSSMQVAQLLCLPPLKFEQLGSHLMHCCRSLFDQSAVPTEQQPASEIV
jgi:hypothetical protein